ncbi:hypothetical protein V494_07814 [Pseudogymnoascus sp. VKM F-4513 (FW-928)]|nr:hypothetical protein V494_07814 [Pseudogymnoascus sp. VKM F-4513 (FW-928)]
MPVTEFQERVYTLLTQIPEGRVTTYGALARALNSSPRAVGNALRNNPFAPEVPCHRCVNASGYINGYNGEVIKKTTFKRTKDGTAQGMASRSTPKGGKRDVAESTKSVLPEGGNVSKKLLILKEEGVEFDERGVLLKHKKVLWDGPWKV